MADKPLLSPEEIAALTEQVGVGADSGYNVGLDVRKHDLVSEEKPSC